MDRSSGPTEASRRGALGQGTAKSQHSSEFQVLLRTGAWAANWPGEGGTRVTNEVDKFVDLATTTDRDGHSRDNRDKREMVSDVKHVSGS